MKKFGIEQAKTGEVSPWFVIGSIEGRIRAGLPVDVEAWNRIIEHALERESAAA